MTPFASTLTGAGADRLLQSPMRIVLVGAGGWIGLATLELLHRLWGDAAYDRVACFGSQARTLTLRGGISFEQQPLDALADLPKAPSLVLHNAFLTQEKLLHLSLEDYRARNRAISGQVLEALDAIGAEGVFVPSSGAVYSVGESGLSWRKQLYGELKREDEAQFTQWARARGARCAAVRVFNLSGPYINKQSDYAIACFINDVLAGRPITIKATRRVYRSYVAISELISLVFGLLTGAEPGTWLFDTAGDDVLELDDLARAVLNALGSDTGIDRPPVDDGEPDLYVGDGLVYRGLMSERSVERVRFPDQARETALYIGGGRVRPGAEGTPC